MNAEAAVTQPPAGYPLRFDVEYPEKVSRLLNLPLIVKPILLVPHFVLLYILAGATYIPYAAFFTILFRRKYPRWWFDFLVAFLRYQERVFIYLLWLRDEYPALEEDQAVHLEVEYPDHLNRWLPLIKWLLAIPHWMILFVLYVIALILVFIAWFAILFTGRYPKGFFDFLVGANRWYLRVYAYAFGLMTDKYPPFSLK